MKGTLMPSFSDQGSWKAKIFPRHRSSQSKEGVVISQRKYALDMLNEISMIDCKQMDYPMDLN